MSHDEALRTLLGVIRSPARPLSASRERATAHVAACSDCWAVLCQVEALGSGTEVGHEHVMAALFGCDSIQEGFFEVAHLAATKLTSRHPEVARHLSWCLACRERFVEYRLVEEAARRGDFDVAADAQGTVGMASGTTIVDLAERLVIRIGEKIAGFSLAPGGFEFGPLLSPVPVRGSAKHLRIGRDVSFALPPSADRVHLTVRPHGKNKVDLELQLSPESALGRVVRLRTGDGNALLLAAHTVRANERVVLTGVAPGQYLIGITEPTGDHQLNVRLDVEVDT